MRAAGIERILWKRGGSSKLLRTLNDMKVLTSRHDIYEDTMNPSNYPFLARIHQIFPGYSEACFGLLSPSGCISNAPELAPGLVYSAWTTAAWPNEIIRQANGDWRHGRDVKSTNSITYDCGVVCDRRAMDYDQGRITEVATRHYLYHQTNWVCGGKTSSKFARPDNLKAVRIQLANYKRVRCFTDQ